jgi:hypothetical protein
MTSYTKEDLWSAIEDKDSELAVTIANSGSIENLDVLDEAEDYVGYNNALRKAAGYGLTTVIEALLKNGCDINETDGYHNDCMTALHIAALKGKPESVQYLIDL